jgi:sugar phosphate isomerase/epimerase
MKTSFSTLACPEWTLQQVLDGAVCYGFDGVELRVLSHELDLWKMPEFSGAGLRATRRLIEDHGLKLVSVSSSANFHSPDAMERERNLELAMRMAEVAAGVGAPSVRVFPDRIQPGCTRNQTANWIASSLHTLIERLQPSGIEVWLETHGDFARAADVSEIVEQMDCTIFGIIWDPANAFAESDEAPYLSAVTEQCLRHVHAKDLRRIEGGKPQYVLTGEGDFPFSTMFASLDAIGYDEYVSFEWERQWHPELVAADVALPHFMNWWKTRKARR